MNTSTFQSLETSPLGQPLIELAEATSTNDVLRELAGQGAAEGTTVVALQQSHGRGRQHRPWHSPPGQGLYLSVLMRPPWAAADSGALALLAGVAVASALQQLGVREVKLKWPNDVLAGGKKICGVLIEPALKGGQIEFAVVGIGVNVRHGVADFPPDLRGTATSCALAGVDVTLAQVRAAVLGALNASYRLALRDGPASLFVAWSSAVAASAVSP